MNFVTNLQIFTIRYSNIFERFETYRFNFTFGFLRVKDLIIDRESILAPILTFDESSGSSETRYRSRYQLSSSRTHAAISIALFES